MSHFAKVVNNIVTEVIVAEQEFFNTFRDTSPGEWLQTSYNTRGNIHYLPNTTTPSGNPPCRGNYAGIGYTYDRINDVFYEPRPHDINGVLCKSWNLNTSSWLWEPPQVMPIIEGKNFVWDEPTLNWVEIFKTI